MGSQCLTTCDLIMVGSNSFNASLAGPRRNEGLRGKTYVKTQRKESAKTRELVPHQSKINNAGSIYVVSKRIGRGEETAEAIAWYENTMVRRYARDVGRLHRRWKVDVKP